MTWCECDHRHPVEQHCYRCACGPSFTVDPSFPRELIGVVALAAWFGFWWLMELGK